MERRRLHTSPGRPLVLIADRHDEARDTYAVALRLLGFDTVTVDDPSYAFGRAWARHPDVVLTEVMLPAFDGWPFVADMRRDSRTRDIPIVVLTGRVDSAV